MIKRYTDYINEELIQPNQNLLEIVNNVVKKIKKILSEDNIIKESKSAQKDHGSGYAIITKDHLDGENNGRKIKLSEHENLTRKRFKLYDDDNVLYYSGYFFDDEMCDNQDDLLTWGRNDSGCTLIKVVVGKGAFEVEIA